jgi:hypothetical protein
MGGEDDLVAYSNARSVRKRWSLSQKVQVHPVLEYLRPPGPVGLRTPRVVARPLIASLQITSPLQGTAGILRLLANRLRIG